MGFIITLILFGLLQGVTEFLPVSSSGHLSLFQYFSKELNDNLSLNVAVHIGTLLTILIYYRNDIYEILQGLIHRKKDSINMAVLILVATLPTGVIGLLMKKKADWILTNPWVSGVCLFLTATFLFLSDRIKVSHRDQSGFGIGLKQAFFIGCVQGFAVLPGISRSGTTILMGLVLGMNPKNASRFSFLISLPAIAGAGLLEFKDINGVDVSSLLIGGVVSFLTGLLAISWMVQLTLKGGLKVFSYYLFPLSIIFLICLSFGWGEGIL